MDHAVVLVASWGGAALHAAEHELAAHWRRVEERRASLERVARDRGHVWSADDVSVVATFADPLDALLVACAAEGHPGVGIARGPAVPGSAFGPALERARRMAMLGGRGVLVAQELMGALELPLGLGSFRVGEAMEELVGHPTVAVRDYR